jgi:hypothetical protein
LCACNNVMLLNANIDHAWFIKAMHLDGAPFTTLPRRYAVDQPHHVLLCVVILSRTFHIYPV